MIRVFPFKSDKNQQIKASFDAIERILIELQEEQKALKALIGSGGGGSGPAIETGWSVASGYTPTKTIDHTACTQEQLIDVVCTLIDLLKSYKLPET